MLYKTQSVSLRNSNDGRVQMTVLYISTAVFSHLSIEAHWIMKSVWQYEVLILRNHIFHFCFYHTIHVHLFRREIDLHRRSTDYIMFGAVWE